MITLRQFLNWSRSNNDWSKRDRWIPDTPIPVRGRLNTTFLKRLGLAFLCWLAATFGLLMIQGLSSDFLDFRWHVLPDWPFLTLDLTFAAALVIGSWIDRVKEVASGLFYGTCLGGVIGVLIAVIIRLLRPSWIEGAWVAECSFILLGALAWADSEALQRDQEEKDWVTNWKRDHYRVTTGTAVPKEGMVAQIGWTSVLRLNTGDIAVGERLSHDQAWPTRRRVDGQLPVSGPPCFVEANRRVLRELAERAPHRYQEAMELMPQAAYCPWVEGKFSGRSDGLFKIDGSDYGYFRWVWLHELGHNVGYIGSKDLSEEFANNYAHQVTGELGG